MARISVQDLVQLPALDAHGAVTLGRRLLSVAASAGPLPPTIARALAELRDADEEVAALEAPPTADAAADPVSADVADRVIDAAWTALHDWLTGWSKLPGGAPDAHRAKAVLAALFPEGLAFTGLTHAVEWAASQERLATIDERRMDRTLLALGGKPFLDALRVAHRKYGAALGLPAPRRKHAREAMDELLRALRLYVVKVTAHVDREDPATVALAEALLAPLTTVPSAPPPPPDGTA